MKFFLVYVLRSWQFQMKSFQKPFTITNEVTIWVSKFFSSCAFFGNLDKIRGFILVKKSNPTKILAAKIYKIFKTFYFRKLSIFNFFLAIHYLHLLQRFLGACKEDHTNTNKNKEVAFWAWLKGWILFRIFSKVTE